jgi:sugar-specific transcriptional regulator TrmB
MDYLNILDMDGDFLEREFLSLSSTLRKIGLTEYESKSYISLVGMGRGSAEEIGDASGVPRTSSYKALQSLEEKGFVESMEGRPVIFVPIPPLEVKSSILDEISETFDKLHEVQGMISERGAPQMVFTLTGKDKVMARIGEIIDSSLDRLIISTPQMRAIRQAHAGKFRDAVRRGVEVVIITDPMVKLPEHSAVYRKDGLLATDIFSDGEIALIAVPDLSLCGYSENPFLVQHLESFLRASVRVAED